MCVSKHWAAASRIALSLEWRRGACAEWRVVNELMGSERVTKVGYDIKAKLVALRERDVVVRGPLEVRAPRKIWSFDINFLYLFLKYFFNVTFN
jgi:hypothetical protein